MFHNRSYHKSINKRNRGGEPEKDYPKWRVYLSYFILLLILIGIVKAVMDKL